MKARCRNIFKMLFHFEYLKTAPKKTLDTILLTIINEIMYNSSLLPDLETRRDSLKINNIH